MRRDARGRFVRNEPPAVFPKRRAVPPLRWPLQRHDILALILTACACAIAWPYHKLILLVVGVAYLLRAWLWLCRTYPLVAWFVFGFVRGLLDRR